MSTPLDQIRALQDRMQASIIGQPAIVERLLLTMLCDGNLLVEGLPGLAKTRAVKSLAKHMEADFNRIQFTPDLLPSDITGSEMYLGEQSEKRFAFQPGPIFANIVLADEINRAPAKVQAALLEAMEERQITVAGKTHQLPPLFMVMATQNPIEQEGTYPLPEAQMDRFLMHVYISHPDPAAELEIVRLVRGEGPSKQREEDSTALTQTVVFNARAEIEAVTIAESLERYLVDLVAATRGQSPAGDATAKYIQVGVSPRGSIAIDKCARGYAWLQGRNQVSVEDIRAVAHDCLRHRLVLSFEAKADGITTDEVLDTLLKNVAIA
ncbi:AAA family ATPase [Coraliomargarita akajimensis]|uniref:ATPase associated with various cellular activities AAA_3 n=1 Tax=Coraliomargarita akajimensis (strain DSM 45221 / IAM 15411 / JCM 23193 / KCTC 12865 / 04OKA010-24) TaxID=583355 RepID=D5EM51_CORAD|nr:AAA family ATPase [Coraliomargarita akajimensis]ADE55211.1 ATPase associated with various cellular activities AAA_3 [Coraliomargarita akajimensis DSM 45221]